MRERAHHRLARGHRLLVAIQRDREPVVGERQLVKPFAPIADTQIAGGRDRVSVARLRLGQPARGHQHLREIRIRGRIGRAVGHHRGIRGRRVTITTQLRPQYGQPEPDRHPLAALETGQRPLQRPTSGVEVFRGLLGLRPFQDPRDVAPFRGVGGGRVASADSSPERTVGERTPCGGDKKRDHQRRDTNPARRETALHFHEYTWAH